MQSTADLEPEQGGRSKRSALGQVDRTWPLRRSDLGRLVVCYVVFCALGVAVGEIVARPASGNVVARFDERTERWFVAHRTSGWDTASAIASRLGATATKATLVIIVVLASIWFLRRWSDALTVALAFILESCVFITVTWMVDRPRPRVVRLDASPLGSSFPSGHVATASTCVVIAVVLLRHATSVALRWLIAAVTVVVPVMVGLSRMYRGMHYPSDVLAGSVLGLLSVVVAIRVVDRAVARRELDRRDGVVVVPASECDADEPATGATWR